MPRTLSAVLLVLFVGICTAQDRGTITGTVTDAAGAAIPGASVKIINPATGLQQSTTTGNDGIYTVPYLPVGRYTVSATKEGFRVAARSGVAVEVATTAKVDLQLEVGAVTEKVEVTAAAPVVVSERSDLGAVMNSKTIIDLPLAVAGGLRDNLTFTILTPGVVFNNGNDNSLRIGGGLSAGQSMMLD